MDRTDETVPIEVHGLTTMANELKPLQNLLINFVLVVEKPAASKARWEGSEVRTY